MVSHSEKYSLKLIGEHIKYLKAPSESEVLFLYQKSMAGYADWINRQSKKKIVELEKKGYNIKVSRYAEDSVDFGDFDEVYTEIRTKQLLEGMWRS